MEFFWSLRMTTTKNFDGMEIITILSEVTKVRNIYSHIFNL